MSRFPTINHLTLTILSAAVAILADADAAMAHPGHGTAAAEAGVLHYLTSPMHIGPFLAIVLLGIGALCLSKVWNTQR